MKDSPPPDRRRITLLAASSLTVMAGAMVSPALPALQHAFADEPRIELLTRLVLTIVALGIAVFGPLVGLVIDRVGRRPVLVGGLVLYGLAGSSALWLDTLDSILVGRAVLGVGVAAVMTASTTLISDYYRGPARERLLGLQAAAMAGGGVVFLLGGGLLADLSWRAPFATYLVAWLLLPMIWRWLPEPDAGRAGGEPDSLADPSLPAGRVVSLYAVATWGMALLYLVPTQLPFFLADRLGASGSAAGTALAALTVGGTLGSLVFPRVLPRLGRVGVLAGTFLLVAPGFGLVALATSWAPIYAGLLLAGFGFGQTMPNLSLWLVELAPVRLRGRVMGGLTTSLFVGQFLSPVMAQPVVSHAGIGGATGVFAVGALTAGIFGIGCLVVALRFAAIQRDQPACPAP